uniref:Zinc metalloproteinase n=1 Tax=Acrobeloides nanus TaxID=290746 RepID=A0A914DL40_9BILA
MRLLIFVVSLFWAYALPVDKNFANKKFLRPNVGIKVFPPLENPLNDYLYQGDMLLSTDQIDLLLAQNQPRQKRQAIIKQYRWNSTTVPFFFDPSFPTYMTDYVRQSLGIWEQQTCLKFVENQTTPNAKIRFFSDASCYSYVGTQSSGNSTHDVSLNSACDDMGQIIHEIGHAIGLFHEQSRYDRDNFIQLDLSNIPEYYLAAAYSKETPQINDNLGIEYDYGSIMQYPDYAYGIDTSRPTMIALEAYHQHTMGQQVAPSFYDYKSINLLYECTCPVSNLQCQNGGYPNPANCAICNCPWGFGGTLCDQRKVGDGNCGSTVTATSSYQTLTGSLGQNDGITYDNFKSCHYHIKAPAGNKVQIKINAIGDVCSPGCYYGSTEFKLGNFQRSGYRFCCTEDIPSVELISAGDLIVVSIYTRNNRQMFQLQYKYVAGSSNPTTSFPLIPTTQPSSCADNDINCSYWANTGYCTDSTYQPYMALNCKKSCNICSIMAATTKTSTTTTTARPPTTQRPTTTTSRPPCNDKDANCAYWYSVGYCTDPTYQASMVYYCPKMCNLC